MLCLGAYHICLHDEKNGRGLVLPPWRLALYILSPVLTILRPQFRASPSQMLDFFDLPKNGDHYNRSRPFAGTEQFTPSQRDGSPRRGSTYGRAVQFCTDSSSLNRLPFNLDVRGIHCQRTRMGKKPSVGPRNSRTGAGLKLQHRLSQPSWRSGHVEKPKRLFDQTHPV
jgi:hypothetical protein